jgi:glycine betaine/choline ABC-type transport system substrate-binding protein
MQSLKSLIAGLALAVAAALPGHADPIVVSSKIDSEGNLLRTAARPLPRDAEHAIA